VAGLAAPGFASTAFRGPTTSGQQGPTGPAGPPGVTPVASTTSMYGTYENDTAPTADLVGLSPASADSGLDNPFFAAGRSSTKARLLVNIDHVTFAGGGTLSFTISNIDGTDATDVIVVSSGDSGLKDSGELAFAVDVGDRFQVSVTTSDGVVSDVFFSWSLYLYNT